MPLKDPYIYIIGGGPSLEGFDFSLLENKCTICVNHSIFDVPKPNYFVTCDGSLCLKEDFSKLKTIPAAKFYIDYFEEIPEDPGPFDFLVQGENTCEFSLSWDRFAIGGNSGFSAIQLAIVLGYSRIALLGFDLNKKGKSHYHDTKGYSKTHILKNSDEFYQCFKQGFESLDPGIRIVSCSKDSRLNDFLPYKEINDVL